MRLWRTESDRSELERTLIWLHALEYSVDDLSDLPGRGRGSFGLLASLGSERRVLVRPSLATLCRGEPGVEGYRLE